MNHIAIDLGGRKSQLCVVSEKGEVLEEGPAMTATLEEVLKDLPRSRVILETCAEAFTVADRARRAGHDPVVVPATLAPALGVGSRGMKNDQRDARHLGIASSRMERLPSVHVPSVEARQMKSLCAIREGLVSSRAQLVHGTRGWLRGLALGPMANGSVETFVIRIRKHIKAHEVEIPSFVERNLKTIAFLDVQIKEADEELEAAVTSNKICQQLMSVPGVGPVTAARFWSAVDEVKRFTNAHEVESYFGLTPGEDSSSERKRITSITKAGSTRVRWTLVQAAWAARRSKGEHPMVRWSLDVEGRRGKRIAVVALARKMVGILYAIWRDGTTYDPKHTVKPSMK